MPGNCNNCIPTSVTDQVLVIEALWQDIGSAAFQAIRRLTTSPWTKSGQIMTGVCLEFTGKLTGSQLRWQRFSSASERVQGDAMHFIHASKLPRRRL